jgi:hypothetical protein
VKIKSKKLNAAVDAFIAEMKTRLAQKEKEGYRGWDEKYPLCELITEIAVGAQRFRSGVHSHQKTSIDIANRAMMIWYRAKQFTGGVCP